MKLPWGEGTFWQAAGAQPVSAAADRLQAAAIEHFPHSSMRVLDLGCGSGIIAIMLALQRPSWQLWGVDIQKHLVELAKQNAQSYGLQIQLSCQDLKDYHDPEGFDLIVSNPPWLGKNSGIPSAQITREYSRRELLCEMRDVVACLSRNLKVQAQALLLYPPERWQQLSELCDQYMLDISSTLACAETNKYKIYHIKSQRKTP